MKKVPVNEVKDNLSRYLHEADPRFLARIARARRSIASGKGTALEDLEGPRPRRKK